MFSLIISGIIAGLALLLEVGERLHAQMRVLDDLREQERKRADVNLKHQVQKYYLNVAELFLASAARGRRSQRFVFARSQSSRKLE